MKYFSHPVVFHIRFSYILPIHRFQEDQMFRNYSLNRILVLVVTAGFAFLLIDTMIEHWGIFSKEPMAYIPVGFSVVGLLIGISAVLQWNERWIRYFQLFLFASFIVAAMGVYLHIGDDDDEKQATEQIAQQKKEKEKPLLAPLAFGGLAVIGLLGTSRKWQAEVL